MNKTLFIAFASAIALGSCTNNEIDITSGIPNGGIPINISTYVPRATRTYVASSNDIWDLVNDGFTFTAINDSSHRTHIASTTFYVKNPDTGVCGDLGETQFFWPRDSAVSFYAVYPTASDDSESGCTWLYAANDSLVFTPDGREDVLAAYASGSASSTDGSVQLNFKHVSAKVALAVRCDKADYNYALTSVVLTAPTKASYKFSTSKISVVAGSDSTEYASVDRNYGETVSVDESSTIYDTLFIAADGTAGSTCRLDVSYKTTITIGGSEIERTYTKSATVNIIAGYENTVSMKLAGDTPLSISVVANGWTEEKNVDANGHEWVDLGLPSGTLWATCNIGAESSEDYGDYFAWGETYGLVENGYSDYSQSKTEFVVATYSLCDGTENTLTKYNYNEDYGVVDNLVTLELSDDAAYVNWGGSWRMPTWTEMEELLNPDYCDCQWTTQNEIAGLQFVGKNGNSIFLPAADWYNVYGRRGTNVACYYWSSSLNLDEDYPVAAKTLYYNPTDGLATDYSGMFRYNGISIRPVIPGSIINF